MKIRFGEEEDYSQLAEMKWSHLQESDEEYEENNIENADKDAFISEFVSFLKSENNYQIFVVEERDEIISAMFLYIIPKLPRPNGKASRIAYLTNVFTRKEYRNQNIGTELLSYIKEYSGNHGCELLFVWPSEKSVKWYCKNGFTMVNEIMECVLLPE